MVIRQFIRIKSSASSRFSGLTAVDGRSMLVFMDPLKFKRSYNDECNAWMVSTCNSRKTISIYEIAALTKKAFHKAIVPGNITSGFRACSIFPFDRNIFCDNDFVADALAAATSSKPYGEGLPALPSVEAEADTSRKVGEPPRF